MSMQELITIIELGLIYGIMTMGVFISYRILDVPDLTVDGSFTLGAAVSIMFAIAGYPFTGVIMGMVAGGLAGGVTALLQTKLKVQPILAGILTMTALYTINLWVMGGKANQSLGTDKSIFTWTENLANQKSARMLFLIAITIVLICIITIFLKTSLGLAIRATGDNEAMVRSSSINVDVMKIIGLMIANMMVGLSGALLGQLQSFADVNMGVGIVIIGLASLIIGEVVFVNAYESLFKLRPMSMLIVAAVIGAVLYRVVIWGAIKMNMSASSMKLISALIIVFALSYPVLKARYALYKKKRGINHA
ncbi:MAG: ABC transporter permease [Cellulosilyticaceae bacterium]